MPSFSVSNNLSDKELEKMDSDDIRNVMMKYDHAMMENEQRGRNADQYTQMRHGYGNALEQAQNRNRALAQMKQHIWERWNKLQQKKLEEKKEGNSYPGIGDTGNRGDPDCRGGD